MLGLRRLASPNAGRRKENVVNDENLMRYLVATMEEVSKGHFTPKVAAREVMAAIRDREKERAREHKPLARAVNGDPSYSER